jgi:diguanylate cyclase (GGDEF)-like protein/PAS domain S-box-containing protein
VPSKTARFGPPSSASADSVWLATLRHSAPEDTAGKNQAAPLAEKPQLAGWWWAIYLAGGATLALAYFLVPSLHVSVVFNLVCLSSPIAILLGIRIHHPAQRLPWFLFAAGQALFVAGDIITYNYPTFFGTEIPFPSVGDPVYLAVYPCLIGGLLLVVRSRMPGRDLGSLIDSLIIALSAGTVSWVLLLSPIATAADSSLDQKLVGMAYPFLDLVLLGVVVRLLVGAGRRTPSLYLMACAASALLVTDGVYSFVSVQGIIYDQDSLLELGWGAFYLLWGAAALHGSMAGLTARAPDVERPLTTPRLAALAGATLLAEMVHAIHDAANGVLAEPVLYAVSIMIFLLVVVRLAGLVQREERSARREKTLREAGASLVAATDRDAVYRATVAAGRRLAGPDSSVGVLSWIDGAAAQLVAADGNMAESLAGLWPILPDARQHLLEHGSLSAPLPGATSGDTVTSAGTAVLLPLVVRGDLRGVLAVASPLRLAGALVAGLEALSVQAALALESAELAEVLANRRSQVWFASLVQNASDVIVVIQTDTTIRFVSPACDRVLGYRPDELNGRQLSDLVHPDEQAHVTTRLDAVATARNVASEAMEFQIRHADGRWLHVETQPSNLLEDPNVNGIVLNMRDVSERKAFEAQLARQAFYDALTGLANRALFQNRVEHALERRRRRGIVASVLFMDLDDFKTVNDSLGHVAGDRLLTDVAARLQKCLRSSDTAARLGGDEFAILVEDLANGPSELATRVLAALAAPFDLDGTQVFVRASIGITVASPGQHGPDAVAALLRNADVAMYSAKAEGGGRWRAFEPAMHDAARLRLELKSALDGALDRDELILNYQPIVDLQSSAMCGVEALVRWVHPERGVIAPLDFIPLAEETGQIVPIGGWVLNEACRAAVQLQRSHPTASSIYMAVNLSARQLQRPEIVDEVAAALAASGLAAEDLVLEITESVLMRDIDLTIERLQRLKDLGVRIAIDDFGTGYSSLNYLRQFPVDIVKIDRSFVEGIAADGDQRALVAMIIDLARALGLRQVAEGIERPDQLAELRSLGCGFGQGYLFARPVDFADLGLLMDSNLGLDTAA